MTYGRKNNGAKKGEFRGAGRKSKADESKLVEKLDSLIDPQIAIEKLYEHN